MACVPIPVVPEPTLPAPLGVTPPPIPDVPGIPNLCCKLPLPPIPPIPISIPPTVLSPAFIATLNAYLKVAVDYINSLHPKCPLE